MEQPSILSKAYNCDCLEYMGSLPDNYFDLAIADPPYGIGASKPSKKPSNILQKNGSIMSASVTDFGKKDWDNNIPTQEFFDELRRVSKNQIIWGANYFGLQGGMIVWDKINGNSDQYDCEIAYQSFNKRTDLVHYMWNGMFQGKYCGRDIRQAAVQQGNKALNEKRIHPTQKPVILYEWLLSGMDALNDPIAVFKYKNINEGRNIIIQLIHEGKRFLAGVHIDKEKNETSVTDIRNLFPKDTVKWLNWIQQGKSMYLNKNEVQAIIAEQRTNHAEVSYVDLDFVAKIVEKFENPKLLDEKIQNTNDIFEEFDDNEIIHLKKTAKQAIHDRITNSWQRSFKPDQVEALNRYHQVAVPDKPVGEVFRELLKEVSQEPDVARKPEKWVADTAKELDSLAEGITRKQSRGIQI